MQHNHGIKKQEKNLKNFLKLIRKTKILALLENHLIEKFSFEMLVQVVQINLETEMQRSNDTCNNFSN